jgi:hypothetical protein
MVARKLAFGLHREQRREAQVDALVGMAYSGASRKLDHSACDLAVHELVDPCNVLVPMTADGKFGFGHLRFQEHLAAMELALNRGITLAPLIGNDWWRGAFLLYAQMADSIDELVAGARAFGGIAYARGVIKEMINCRPAEERPELNRILTGESELAESIQFMHEGVYDYAYTDSPSADDLDPE